MYSAGAAERMYVYARALIKTKAAAVVLGLLENRFKLEKEEHRQRKT